MRGHVAHPGEILLDALGRISGRTDGRALVMDAGRVAGILPPGDVARTLELAALRRGGQPAHYDIGSPTLGGVSRRR